MIIQLSSSIARSRFVLNVLIVVALAVSGCVTSETKQKASGWLRKEAAMRESGRMLPEMIPSSMDCRFEESSSAIVYATKVKWVRNVENKGGMWRVGNLQEMAAYDREAAQRGLHKTFSKRISDSRSGKLAACAIWLE